jgi:uncharacterized protein (TIGR03790 family)
VGWLKCRRDEADDYLISASLCRVVRAVAVLNMQHLLSRATSGCTLIATWIPLAALLVCFFCGVNQALYAAIDESNVLVIYNADDGPAGEGFQIANYYQQVHPGVHVIGIQGVDSYYSGIDTQAISAAAYLDPGDGTPGSGGIRQQVLDAIANIADSIDVIVTTKGMPLKIDAGAQPSDTSSNKWRRFSSLESELTRIDSIDTTYEMGDQFIMAGFPQWDRNLASNPYYNTNAPFNRSDPANEGIRLTSRLDGYSVDAVNSAIDRAQKAFVVRYGQFVVADDSPAASSDQMIDGSGPGPGLAAVLDTFGQAYVYENSTDATIQAPGPIIGYVSHGVHGGLGANYITNQLDFQISKGAVYLTHESYNAFSFNPAFPQGQGLVAEWLEIGGTAGLGHVAEPFNGPDNVTNEDLLFQMLLPNADAPPGLPGLTFAEAAWNATRQLSYVNTVVGDPLMRLQIWLAGDGNLDGRVDVADLTLVQENWFQQGTFAQGDFNGDGWVNVEDLTLLQGNWLTHIEGSDVVPPTFMTIPVPIVDPNTGIPIIPKAIPEPSSICLALFSLGCLYVRRQSLY